MRSSVLLSLLPSLHFMSDNSSASSMIVALVAIVIIVAIGFLVYKQLPMSNNQPGTNIDITIPGTSSTGNY